MLEKQIKRFHFDQDPLSLNNFTESDFSDPDLCNDFLFVLFSHVKEKTLDPSLLDTKKLCSLVKSRNNAKAFHFFHLMTNELSAITHFLYTLYNTDNLLFTGNIHNKQNYEQLTHYLSDYIFRVPGYEMQDDIIMKAWLIHILYEVVKQLPDKEKEPDIYFLIKIFFEQPLFSQYNEIYNNASLDNSAFFFLTNNQQKLSLSEYFMIAREDLYYCSQLHKKTYLPSPDLCEYLKIIKHSVNNTQIKIFIEQHSLQSKVVQLPKTAYSSVRL